MRPGRQVALGTFMCFIFVLCYTVSRPFAKPGANAVTTILNILLFFFFYLALLLKLRLENDNSTIAVLITYLFAISFVAPFMPFVYTVRAPAERPGDLGACSCQDASRNCSSDCCPDAVTLTGSCKRHA